MDLSICTYKYFNKFNCILIVHFLCIYLFFHKKTVFDFIDYVFPGKGMHGACSKSVRKIVSAVAIGKLSQLFYFKTNIIYLLCDILTCSFSQMAYHIVSTIYFQNNFV